jgi:hypothetical protein
LPAILCGDKSANMSIEDKAPGIPDHVLAWMQDRVAMRMDFGFSRTLRAVWGLYPDDGSGRPWSHGHGGHLVPSPLLSIVPAALEISYVLPTANDVTIKAGLA